ncbi:hypothetical protein LVB77_10610 [Lysobacter sp. 5GHs7-4]|uniref:hypothetical protein n=1 Tax=Lysobacter sp. 5GHs7-4 TaxID=2904253 RepID=UPI001E53BFA5|nr:hypothetical protein [Lysobacter sp. 5GHs7-4]UHQ25090.1 hypothetical protein LVB77_10610 [Lysobacter sp. 5GHs7-4]
MKTSLLPAATALPVLLAWALSGAAATPAAEPAPSGPLAAKAVSEALGAALRADVPTALTALKAAPAEQFNAKDIAFRSCMIERHERSSPPPPVGETDDPLARKVLDLYQNYWWHAVRDPAGRPARDAQLKADLAATIGEKPPADGDEAFDALTERINVKLRAAGLHPLQGRTPPLYDLLVWRQQEERDYTVALPGGEQQPVKVFVMDDWLSRGWSHYTACSYTGAAGWANEQGLFAVRSAYGDLKGEDFKVSFLGHESQHYADLKRWPEMPPWTLEYRAKLVELALADDTRIKLLDRFYRSQDDEPDHPHPYANKRVIAAVLAKLGLPATADLRQADPEATRRAAREVLIEDTRKRKAETPAAAPKT